MYVLVWEDLNLIYDGQKSPYSSIFMNPFLESPGNPRPLSVSFLLSPRWEVLWPCYSFWSSWPLLTQVTLLWWVTCAFVDLELNFPLGHQSLQWQCEDWESTWRKRQLRWAYLCAIGFKKSSSQRQREILESFVSTFNFNGSRIRIKDWYDGVSQFLFNLILEIGIKNSCVS